MVIANALYNEFVPSIVQIDSLGIGIGYSNTNLLDLTNDSEYLVVGARHNVTNNTLDTKYNMIVNSDGVSINSTRRMFDNIHSNIYQNAGLYVTNDILCEGKVIAKGLELQGVTLANEITPTVLNNLIQAINTRDPLFYTGFNNLTSNNLGQIYSRENIYTTSYVTIGGLTDTFSNSHPLNIIETANNSIDNIQISLQNDINNETEPAKMRIGMVGASPYSPATISTTVNMPLEFHVSIDSQSIDNLYSDGTGFPNYRNNYNIPAMTIDARRNVAIGTSETDSIKFTQYNKDIIWRISKSEKEEYSKLKVDGSAFIKNIITYDYYTHSNLHLDDIYVRTEGLTVKTNQIKEGDFNKGIFRFHSNLFIGQENDNYLLEVNSELDVKGNLSVDKYSILNDINVSGVADFNGETRFSKDVHFDNDLNVSNNLRVIHGDIFYNQKRLNITELYPIILDSSLLNSSNITGSNIIYFANNTILNISGSNLAIPGRLGVGILDTDSYDQQMVINKRTDNIFELMLQDYSKNTADSSKVYIGHIKGLKDQYSQLYTSVEDSSFMIFTQRNVTQHNIYFFAGKDLNRTYGIKNQIPSLAIMQNDTIGINTNKPEKTLDVIGDIVCNDLYVRKNRIIYKTAHFQYTNNLTNNIIYLYDQNLKKVCINFVNTANVDLKGLNVVGGINSIHGYFDNNIKTETLKYHSSSSVNINKNISIGWKGENTVVPLQVRNLSIQDNNFSIIRIYRGLRGGGFNNDATYSGIDICEYDPVLPIYDKNNFKWFMYKYHIDTTDSLDFQKVGPLQFGYTDNTLKPTSFGLTMYYNKNKTYHIDVNNPKVSYNYKPNVAMSIYGDLEVHGNINLIDNSNIGINYKINGITVSSNIAQSIIDNRITNQTFDDYILSKDDISINGQKIVILPTKTTAIGYVDNWFLQYVQRVQNDTTHQTPLVIYQKNANKAICKFGSTDMNTPSTASIELGILYTKKNYTGENKNMVEFKVLGYNNKTILELNAYNAFDQVLRPLITFYNNGTKSYTNFGSYSAYNQLTGVPIVENVCLHINDPARYLLQLSSHSKKPIINLHRADGIDNNYWLLNGADNNKSFSIEYGHSGLQSYEPETSNQILTITYDGKLGLNKINPEDTLDISSVYNVSSVKFTNNYMNSDLYDIETNITIINSNLKLINEIPILNTYNSNTDYLTKLEYTIDTSNLPTKDNSNITLLNYFLIDKEINLSNISKITTYHEVNAKLHYSNLSMSSSNINISYMSCNISNIYISQKYNYSKDITLLPILKQYDYFDLFIPEIFIDRNALLYLSNVYNINIKPNYNLQYNYSNIYNIPNVLLPTYDQILTESSYKITSNIKNNITSNILYSSNIYVYNTINTLLPISSNVSYNSFNIFVDTDVQLLNVFNIGYSNYIITSNLIWYNNEDYYYLGVATNRSKDYTHRSVIKAPETIVGTITQNNSNYVINCNVNLISTIDFLTPTPVGLQTGLDFTSYITRQIVNNSNYIDNFEIYDIPQSVIVSVEDAYYLYNFLDYIHTFNLNIKHIKYQPHITLQNYIKLDDVTSYPIDKVHKIYSYEGNFDLILDKNGNSDKILSISEYGDTTLKGAITVNDIIIKGHIYDSMHNDLVQQINSDVYTINATNYEISASNIVFNPQGSYGILINAQERNYTNNIFQINSGKKNDDANFITLYTYTNGSYIHFTSHMLESYNTYKDMMYRFGMHDDLFGIWRYTLNDVATLPGGYIDGSQSSTSNYNSAMTIKWNDTDNIFDFDFNGSLNLDETSNSYLKIGNLKIKNSIISQNNYSSNIVSFNNWQNEEILTITNSNIGIYNPVPNQDYKLHIGGNIKIDGDIRADGNFITASDKRYKTDIKRIENALEKITKISGITYNNILSTKEEEGPCKRQSGLIAQEVNNILPEVVKVDKEGYMSLAYGNMMGIIVESIKELKCEIDLIKTHLNI